MRRSTTCLSTIDQRSFVSRKWHREEGVEIRTNIVEKGGWTRTKVRDGRGDSPWNTNSFRDNGHWAGVRHPHTLPSLLHLRQFTRTRRGAASRSRFHPSRSLPFISTLSARKERGIDRPTTSLDKFIHNLFDDFVISLRETYFSILNMLRIFRPREIFKTCDEVGPGFARSFAFFGNRIQFCLERMCGLVWSEVYWLISIKSCLAASSSFLTFKRFCLTVVKKFPNSFSNVIFVLKLDKEIEWRESCNR